MGPEQGSPVTGYEFGDVMTARRGPLKQVDRTIRYLFYSGVAKHLPRKVSPGGRIGRAARNWACRGLFEHLGVDTNVDAGAYFASGSRIRLGDRSGIGAESIVLGSVHIGNDVMIGPRCVLLTEEHAFADTTRAMNTQGMLPDAPIVIEDDVWLGVGVTVLPGVRIGRSAIIAAGAVVTHDIEPLVIAGGVPAKKLKSRGDLPHLASVTELPL